MPSERAVCEGARQWHRAVPEAVAAVAGQKGGRCIVRSQPACVTRVEVKRSPAPAAVQAALPGPWCNLRNGLWGGQCLAQGQRFPLKSRVLALGHGSKTCRVE